MADGVDILERFKGKEHVGGDEGIRSITVAAISDVIIELRPKEAKKNGPPTPTEYFASIMTALQGRKSPQWVPLMFLLSEVLVSVPRSVLARKGPVCISALISVLKQNSGEENDENESKLTRYCLTALGVVLGGQELTKAAWDNPKTTQALLILFNTVADERPKVRKVAQQAVMTVLEAQAPNPAPCKLITMAATTALSNTTINECTDGARLVHFLAIAMPVLAVQTPLEDLWKLVHELCKSVRLGHAQVSKSCFFTLDLFLDAFISHRSEPGKKIKKLSTLVRILAEQMNDSQSAKFLCGDVAVCTAWANCTRKSEATLYKMSLESGQLTSCLDLVARSYITPMGAGLRFATDSEKSATAQPQVVVPLGNLVNLLHEEAALSKIPDVLFRVIDELDILLTPQFEDSWPLSLEIIRTYFVCRSSSQLEDTPQLDSLRVKEQSWLRKLVEIREKCINPVTGMDNPKVIMKWKASLERTVGGAIASIGPEEFLEVAPLRGLEDGSMKGLAPIRSWLVPILRESIGTGNASSSLAFFRSYILSVSQECIAQSEEPGIGNNSSRMLQMRAMQMWSLFPSFCNKANDVCAPAGFAALAPILGSNLENPNFPELLEYICTGMRNLINSVKDSEEDCKAVSSLARNFLPLLFNLYDQLLSQNKVDYAALVHELISVYSGIAPRDLVNKLFRDLLQRLIVSSTKRREKPAVEKKGATVESKNDEEGDSDDEDVDEADENDGDSDEESLDDEEKTELDHLSSLSVALVPSLDETSCNLLFQTIGPFLEEEHDQGLQKRGYRVLESLCRHQPNWVLKQKDTLIETLSETLSAASASSKTARLKCLDYIISALHQAQPPATSETATGVVGSVIGEILLCTKDSNKKARSVGYKVICTTGTCLDKVFELEGKPSGDGLKVYFAMLVGTLAAKTPHMRSAALNAIARVFGFFGTRPEVQTEIVEVAQAALMLTHEKAREVAKSVIAVSKVCIIRLPLETVNVLLKDVLSALLPWANDTKNRYSVKIRIIIERAIKRLGEDVLLACDVLPKDHALLNYIRKMTAYKKRRFERKKLGGIEHSGSTHDKMSDSEDDEDDSRANRKRRNARDADEDVIMDEGGDALDLMGSSALGRVKRSIKKLDKLPESKNAFKITSDGRIVIPGSEPEKPKNEDDMMDSDDEVGRGKRRRFEDSDDEADAGGKPKDKKKDMKKKQLAPGAEYKATKAGGDVKRKGVKLDPHAYIQLNPKMLNRRKRNESGKQFKGILGKQHKGKGNRNNKK